MYFEAQILTRRLFFLPCRQRCSVKSSDPDRTKIYYGNATTGRKCAFGAIKSHIEGIYCCLLYTSDAADE